MTSKQLDRLLYNAVAEALGVDLPKRQGRPRTRNAKAPAHAARATAAPRRHEAVLEHA